VTSLCLGVKRRIPKFPRGVAAANLPTGNPAAMPLSAESSRSIEMKTLLLACATVALLTAVNFAPAMAQGQSSPAGNTWAGISQPVDNTPPIYPIPQTMYEEVIAKYRIGSSHKALYANLTGNQMWSIVQSKFGQPSQQAAIAEARQACEDHATQSNLDPGKCVPVAVDDRQVFDPGPLFSVAERAQDQQANLSTLVTPPRE
jgi:hypothetical protein